MDEWLTSTRDAVAERAGVTAQELELDRRTIATLLDLARIAAHESGARTNAPLLCFLLGRAVERGADLEQLAAAVRRTDAAG